jgi:hypothetical protein
VGEETRQFASRFSEAVGILADVASRGGGVPTDAEAGAVRRALDAIAAVYETETSAMRDWPEARRRALAAVARVREVLAARSGGDALGRAAGALVALVGATSPREARAEPGTRRPRTRR